MIGDRQRQILNLFNGDPDVIVTTAEIKTLFGPSYYANGDNHVQATITRSVKSGLLKRIRRGAYKLGPGRRQSTGDIDPNQKALF